MQEYGRWNLNKSSKVELCGSKDKFKNMAVLSAVFVDKIS